MDRRLIRERIGRLKAELRDVEKHRELIRSQRQRFRSEVRGAGGYTSAGKDSSIENALTGAGILEGRYAFLDAGYHDPLPYAGSHAGNPAD